MRGFFEFMLVLGVVVVLVVLLYVSAQKYSMNSTCQVLCAEKHSTSDWETVFSRDLCICFPKDGSINVEKLGK